MSHSTYFKLVTWNLFKLKGVQVTDWPGERQEGMRKTVASLEPDILCTQETAPEYLETLLRVNEKYRLIVPSFSTQKNSSMLAFLESRRGNPLESEVLESDHQTAASGWLNEGNILWNSELFEYVSHGAEDIGLEEAESRRPKRRLFWVRLRVRRGSDSVDAKRILEAPTILVTTAHLTWEGGCASEQTEPYPHVRKLQAVRAADAIEKTFCANEAVVFCGDMNDSWHVPFFLRERGLHASDFALNLPNEVTHPARPFYHEERIPSQTRDWIFSKNLKVVLSRVCSDMTLGLSRHPSDHYPVCTVFRID